MSYNPSALTKILIMLLSGIALGVLAYCMIALFGSEIAKIRQSLSLLLSFSGFAVP